MASMTRGSGTRSTTTSAVGMMEGAFFVSRSELLGWVNNLLNISLSKVEQCASGAVYCQIIDALRPNTVAMRKVNWMAKSDHEFIPNYKVLQAAFDKLNIDKHVEVDKLIRAKYQDNLEFLQWMKCHWERDGGALMQGYDAVQAREGRPLPPWARCGPGGEKENLRPASAGVPPGAGGGLARRLGEVAKPAPVATKPAPTGGARPAMTQKTPRTGGPMHSASLQTLPSGELAEARGEIEALRRQLRERDEELVDLRDTVDGLESERDYYYNKLRSVELLCTGLQGRKAAENEAEAVSAERRSIVDSVLEILYHEGDEEGEAPDAA